MGRANRRKSLRRSRLALLCFRKPGFSLLRTNSSCLSSIMPPQSFTPCMSNCGMHLFNSHNFPFWLEDVGQSQSNLVRFYNLNVVIFGTNKRSSELLRFFERREMAKRVAKLKNEAMVYNFLSGGFANFGNRFDCNFEHF